MSKHKYELSFPGNRSIKIVQGINPQDAFQTLFPDRKLVPADAGLAQVRMKLVEGGHASTRYYSTIKIVPRKQRQVTSDFGWLDENTRNLLGV